MSGARDESCRPGWPSPHLVRLDGIPRASSHRSHLARCRAGAGQWHARGVEPV